MNARNRTAAVILAATVPFAPAACGNSDAAHAKASLKVTLLTNANASGSQNLTDTQATCLSDGLVDKIGVKQLQADKIIDAKANAIEHSLNNNTLPKADATKFADTYLDCTDHGAAATAAIKSALEASATDATKTCIDSKLTAAVVRDFMIAGFSGGNSASTAVLQTAVMTPCAPASK